MNTFIISKHQNFSVATRVLGCIALAIACSLALPYLFSSNRVIGFVDAGIWQLLLIAFIAWTCSFWLSVVALNWLLERLGLPAVWVLVKQFNKLTSWQKLKSYFLLFVSLLGSVGLTIVAVI